MNCSKCGKKISVDDSFCSKCGSSVNTSSLNKNLGGKPIISNLPVNNIQNVPFTNKKEYSRIGAISITLGIISIILFFLGIIDTVIAVVGIILGILAIKKHKEKSGLILNVVGLFLSVVVSAFVVIFFYSIVKEINSITYEYDYDGVVGKWMCVDSRNVKPGKKDYELVLDIDYNEFELYGYKDRNQNYIFGTYLSDEINKNGKADFNYYMLELTGEGTIIINGENKSSFKGNYEIGIKKDHSEAILTESVTGTEYTCYEGY